MLGAPTPYLHFVAKAFTFFKISVDSQSNAKESRKWGRIVAVVHFEIVANS